LADNSSEKSVKAKRTKTKNKELKIRTNEEEQTIEITLDEKNFKIDIKAEEYSIYTNSADSYIIAKQPNLELNYNGFYLDITRISDSYTIETNEDIELDCVVSNLVKNDKMFCFTVEKLSEIEAVNGKLKISETTTKNNVQDNNILIISEEDGKVYLPYTKEEIERKIEETKSESIEEIIEKNYVVPIEKYKSSIKARFREAYNLMRVKENKSKKSAIMLGIELMFEFNLHSAIISACNTLEELDTYLDCLEDNELDKFKYFKVVYKTVPTVKNKKAF